MTMLLLKSTTTHGFFVSTTRHPQTIQRRTQQIQHVQTTMSSSTASNDSKTTFTNNDKETFLNSLEHDNKLNKHTNERSFLLRKLLYNKQVQPSSTFTSSLSSPNSIQNPGSLESIQTVASGLWKVIYAPHMTTMANIGGGELDVQYDLKNDFTMTSHARYDFPFFKQKGYLSVSGTYGSVNELVCRVDFDQAWFKPFPLDEEGKMTEEEDVPYASIEQVPDSVGKSIITNVGNLMFLESVSVFPVSYMDDDLCVFDFELLGTRIVARKIK